MCEEKEILQFQNFFCSFRDRKKIVKENKKKFFRGRMLAERRLGEKEGTARHKNVVFQESFELIDVN